MFAEWAVRGNPDMLVLPGGALPGIGPSATGESVTLHLVTAAIFAAGFGVAGFLAQGRSTSAIIPVVWSAAATFMPLALLIALYARIAHLDRSIPFAILAVILAAAFGGVTEMLTRRENRPGLMISTALFATGTLGALALALTFALEKGWLTIALALMSLGTAWISMQRPIPFLRTLAAVLAAIVVMRDRLRAAHRGRRHRHHADLQLAALGLRHSRRVVLARQRAAAPPRRRRAAAHGGGRRDPVHGAAGVPGDPPCHLWRRRLSRHPDARRIRARSLRPRWRWRSGSSGCGCAPTASCTMSARSLLTVFAGLTGVFGLLLLENPILTTVQLDGAFINLLLLAMRCRRC